MSRNILYIFLFSLLSVSCQREAVRVDALAFCGEAGKGWGLVRTDGQVVVPAHTFDNPPATVVNGVFSVRDEEGFYRLHRLAEPLVPVSGRRFARIGHFFGKVAPAQETLSSPVLLIDRDGNTVASTAQYPQYNIVLVHNFREGRALVATREGKYGYMDEEGNLVVPPLYDRAYDFREGKALVGMINSQGELAFQLIDVQGRVVLPIQLNNCRLDHRIGNGWLMFKNLHTDQCAYLDEEGRVPVCLAGDVKEAYTYEKGLAVFQTVDGSGMLNAEGKICVPALYEKTFVAGEGRIGVRKENRWGLADADGNLLTPFRYERMGRFYETGQAVAVNGGNHVFIDRQGNETGGTSFACIVEDSTVNAYIPQVFICQEEEKEADVPAKEEASSSAEVETRKERTMPERSVISADAWKRISRQNPFYEEAGKVFSGGLEEEDAENRRMILNYVEHLRTSYTTKDIDFLEQLFSERALIIVGTVVRTGMVEKGNFLSPSQVVYNVKSKQEYLNRLKQIFKANRKIDVTFSNFRIMRHPTQPGIYGVSLRQGYSSDIYSDDGYLFLLWDFRDETAPQIHVRTWQPRMLDERTSLPEDEIFSIHNFNLQ